LIVEEGGEFWILVEGWERSTRGYYTLQISEATNVDVYEPDDTLEQASPIEPGEIQEHTLHDSYDMDFVRFEVEAGVRYTLATNYDEVGEGYDLDTVILLINQDGYVIVENDDYEDSLTSRLSWTFDVSGTFYALVMAYDPYRYFEDGSYQLSFEGGDTSATDGGGDGCGQDEDCSDEGDGSGDTETDGGDSGSEDGSDTGDTAEDGSDTGDGSDTEGDSGEDTGGSDSGDDGEVANLAADIYEPDNTPTGASRIRADEPQDRTLHSTIDLDYVFFQAESGQVLTIQTAVPAGQPTDTVLSVVTEDGALLAEADDADGGETLQFTAPSTGEFYIRVMAFDSQSIGGYTLSLD